jgi:succinate dehydrogenase/fumarate reductase flavoprotein subunit
LLDGLVFGHRVVEAIASGVAAARDTGAMTGILDYAVLEPDPAPVAAAGAGTAGDAGKLRSAIQRTMSSDCGVVRDAAGLEAADATLAEIEGLVPELPAREVASCEVVNLARVSRAIVAAATVREESRGAHTRADFPESRDEFLGRIVLRGRNAVDFVPLPAPAGASAGGAS